MLSGSLRAGSTNEALLRTAALLLPADVRAVRYPGMARLPHFNPDDDQEPLPEPVAELRSVLSKVDAVLICTPEYAGGLPGSFKNLLDWTVGGIEINEKPTAWVNCSGIGPNGAARTHESLRAVLTYTGALIVEDACVRIPVQRPAVGPEGVITDAETRARIGEVLTALLAGIRQGHPDDPPD
jgi:NAD(P)H-dependent FMN reductase